MKTLSSIGRHALLPLLDNIAATGEMALPVMPTSAAAFLAHVLHQSAKRSVLCIAPSPVGLAQLHKDWQIIAGRTPVLYFPAAHQITDKNTKGPASEDLAAAGHRLNTLSLLAASRQPVMAAASIQALLQKLPAPEKMRELTLELQKGQPCDRDSLSQDLLASGYEFTEEVLEQGSCCVRGGIIDIWPLGGKWPVRLELEGTVIESIRSFDPADQRSRGTLEKVKLPPPGEMHAPKKALTSFLSYMPKELVVLWTDPAISEHGEMFESTSDSSDALFSLDGLRRIFRKTDNLFQIHLDDEDSCTQELDILPAQKLLGVKPSARHADAFEETRQEASRRIEELLKTGYRIILSCSSEGSARHFFQSTLASQKNVSVLDGALSSGFASETGRFAVISENDLLPAKGISSLRYSPFGEEEGAGQSGFRPAEITDLEPEDLVVHAEHGIGIYKGINEITVGGQLQEVLSLEYADGMILHVPVSQAHLLSRYVGLPHHKARLHKLGGKRWKREKNAAHQSIMDMAASLLDLQAQRAVQPGHGFSRDKPWQRDFEAAFRYQETNDQIRAIADVKGDMESPHPMDRLICGDAGYGKTEVAMRSAFKAVMDNKQVAVLVPTTVLAQQHFDTFSERMSIYPVNIAMLSRFRSRAERTSILKGLTDGTVDIVIGTHALLQPGVSFRDLGLVIIDEEQRFGVEHKERLKQMRKLVDVLTMTATPIPRTLYLSMTGAREMSLIQTPPNERLPVKTVVAKNTDATITNAVNNELHREGQVFYLHNRIMTIERVHKRLTQLVPKARIAVAHGRMNPHELSEVMHDFARGEIDVLLCTTIIESGLDIPCANTILIDRADRFGIADLYQLRGRVGRSTRKAYAYLLLPERGRVDSDARSRIGAVKTYSGLAAGFNLALRDMEIRGVGNILGAEQSGHISAIGFGLYCQLLKLSVANLKGEKAPPPVTCIIKLDFVSYTFADADATVAAIPFTYVEEERLRLGIYRKIAEAASMDDVKRLSEEIADRFGPLDPAVERLLKITRLRIRCAHQGVSLLETRDDRLMITKDGDFIKKGSKFPRLSTTTPDKRLQEIYRFIERL